MTNIKRNSGTKGSVAQLSIKNNELYTFNDISYVFSYTETINTLYEKLRALYDRSQNKTHHLSYKKWCAKNKVDTRLMPIMKHYSYCNQNCDWDFETPPSKADAIFLQLKIRESYQQSRLKTLEKREKREKL